MTFKKRGIRVPENFATTAEAYWRFLEENDLKDKIGALLQELEGEKPLDKVGKAIRSLLLRAEFSEDIAGEIRQAYRELGKRYKTEEVDVAVRSSATAEDLPESSFAGQQESFLNVTGETELLEYCRRCFASLFTDRAITYRREHGFDDMKAALSVGVQKMVRSDLTGALSGLVGIFSVWFAGQYFGASTSFVRTAGMIEQFFGAERVTQMDYFIKVAPASTGNGCLFWGISGVNDPGAHLRIV